jgi:hypothetical protein
MVTCSYQEQFLRHRHGQVVACQKTMLMLFVFTTSNLAIVTFCSSSFELSIRRVNGLMVPDCYYLFVASTSKTFGTGATITDVATIAVNCFSVLRK